MEAEKGPHLLLWQEVSISLEDHHFPFPEVEFSFPATPQIDAHKHTHFGHIKHNIKAHGFVHLSTARRLSFLTSYK